jgi:adenine phosphoribosyltransferase
MDLKQFIRDVPDFPKPGIIFKDITTLLKEKEAFQHAIDLMAEHYKGKSIDKIVAIESRGFVFGSPLAYKMGAGFVPVRKPKKLPSRTHREEYALEYGTDCVEIHYDAIDPGEKILVVDDLLATGGTAGAVVRLMQRLDAHVVGLAFLIELAFLKGREKLGNHDVFALIQY